MRDKPDKCARPIVEGGGTGPRSGRAILALVAIALGLAITFFYLTENRRADRRADAVTGGAQSVENAARAVEDAARNAADKFRK